MRRYQMRFATADGRKNCSRWTDRPRLCPQSLELVRERLASTCRAGGEFLSDEPREANSEGGRVPCDLGHGGDDADHVDRRRPFRRAGCAVLARVCPQRDAGQRVADRDQQSGRRAEHRVRRVRFGFFLLRGRRAGRPALLFHANWPRIRQPLARGGIVLGVADAGPADIARRHRHDRRGPGCGARLDARRVLRLRRKQMANHLADRPAAPCRRDDRHDIGHCPAAPAKWHR